MSTVIVPESTDVALAEEVARYYDDPLGFVRFAYPWGEEGPLQDEPGPDVNQIEFLSSLREEVKRRKFDGSSPVMPIRMAETSGHGTGKSAQGAWIADWILSTRPNSIGTITAGTFQQLEEKTWAAVTYWTKLCITAHWFDIQASGIYHKKFPQDWKVTPQTCKQENAQSFAGQHARRSTSWYLFDEASEVPDKIWETAEGGLTDGEPMFFAWGQPVRNTGEFHKVCFGDKKERWNTRRVDSRQSRLTNKPLLEQWIADYGLNSDFCKTRILGMPPSASELQYIDRDRVEAAAGRKMVPLHDDPLIAGFDVSGGGKAWNVIRFRRGLDGNPEGMTPIRIPGENDPDRSQRVGVCAELLKDRRPGRQLAALFIDSAFGAAIAERLRGLGFKNVYEIVAGSPSPDFHCLNMRAYMWMKSKEYMLFGSLRSDENLPEAQNIKTQMCIPGYHINNSSKLVIESKQSIAERGGGLIDDADAFNLTFARAVAPRPREEDLPAAEKKEWSWM
jgi:hypothetical protein